MKPHLDFQGARRPKFELDYLRLIYAVSEIRKQGEDAQGYFVVTAPSMLRRMSQIEHEYRGKNYAEVLSVSLGGYLMRIAPTEKAEILSGIVRAAALDTSAGSLATSIHSSMREFILAETILGLESNVQQVKDESRFPFCIRWDYYGVVE